MVMTEFLGEAYIRTICGTDVSDTPPCVVYSIMFSNLKDLKRLQGFLFMTLLTSTG
jgi:hypothetical protein